MPNNFTHPFDDPNQIAESLTKFKSVDWDDKTFQDVANEYRSLLKVIPIYPVIIKKGTTLFRGRQNDGDEPFTEFKDISIKPADLIKTIGRANLPHQPVFYCSSNEETVAREVTQWYINDNGRAQDLYTRGIVGKLWNPFNAFMTISAWHVKEDLHLGLLFNADTSKRSLAIQQYHQAFQDISFHENENRCKSRNLVLDFFSQEFGKIDVKHESEYLYSAYYANEIYNNQITEYPNLKLDGVKFASIASENRGENYAIKEDSFKTKMDFLGANLCIIHNNNRKGAMPNPSKAIISRIQSALLKDDQTFDWVNSDNGVDYIVRIENRYSQLVFPPSGYHLPMARI